jgi:CRISPR-associated protein (TIGR03984 family)
MPNQKPKIDLNFSAPTSDDDVKDWIIQQASETIPFLIAFADDGVIWGKWDQELKLAPAAFQGMIKQLRGSTLQQAFIFGKEEEVRLFRDTTGEWKSSKITDTTEIDAFDEIQVLWGDDYVHADDGFVHLRDKVQQGMDQVLPLDITKDELKVPRLQIRHYVEYDDETGEARVFLSRLVKLGKGIAAKEEIQ